MSGATRSLGTTLSVGETKVGGLTSITPPELSAETIDVTTLDSIGGYREFLAGFKSGGEASLEGFFYAEDEGQQALNAAFESGEEKAFTIAYPNGAAWSFSGVLTGFAAGAAGVEDALSFSATITVNGAPTLAMGGGISPQSVRVNVATLDSTPEEVEKYTGEQGGK